MLSIFELSDLFKSNLPFLTAECPPNKGNFSPQYVLKNEKLISALGLSTDEFEEDRAKRLLIGTYSEVKHKPVAQAYAGHQFGHYSPLLGDGRAMLLGEIPAGNQWVDVHLKGSGATVFSRGGDGRAVIGPMLREYIFSEFFAELGIPTTRSLAVLTTGDEVLRNGYEPGAVLVRTASSHIRIGSFELTNALNDYQSLRQLLDFALLRHDPDLLQIKNVYERARSFFQRVVERQLKLVAKWMAIGFVHGVMNTDNVLVSGETIDYGPCAMIDYFNKNAVYSSIDKYGRYKYSNQPDIMLWNLARFSEALFPLLIESNNLDNEEEITLNEHIEKHRDKGETTVEWIMTVLEDGKHKYNFYRNKEFSEKIGLFADIDNDVVKLIDEVLNILHENKLDFTTFFVILTNKIMDDDCSFDRLFENGKESADFLNWLDHWQKKMEEQGECQNRRLKRMKRVNPRYIPRNQQLFDALNKANGGEFSPFIRLLELVKNNDSDIIADDFIMPPSRQHEKFVTYCGT